MNEEFIKQIIAELIEANQQALSIVVASISRQIDADRLKSDLESQIAAAKLLKQISPIAIQQATNVLAAVHAETLLQKKPTH